MREDEKAWRWGWKCVARGMEMHGEGAGNAWRRRDENAWRRRDGYVGTRQRLRRDAVGATSGRNLKVKG